MSIEASGTESIATPTISTVTDNDTVVTGTGTVGKTVRVELPDGTIKTGTVGNDGKYSIEIPKQAKDKVIKVMLYDGQGNVSPEASTTVVADTVAPPTINAVTSDDTTVKGTGVNGATVTLTIGSATYTGTVSGGEYSITIPKQSAGTVITATESLNGKTSTSVNTTVTQGTVAAPTIGAVTTNDTTVKGTGVNGATVTVTIGSQDYTATVSGGEYSITIPKQSAGTVITATESLNGKTSTSVNTTVTQGSVAAPTINGVKSDDTTVKGRGI
ncbi:autolysin modifier protein, partial [Listeria welshimeri]|nr:autolysin modifier protein [Listeria welshimeri]